MGKIQTALDWMINLANDNSHGYSQDAARRWGPTDYDCSAAVITAWENAGVPVKSAGAITTQNMKPIFLANGFTDVTSKVNLTTCAGLEPGDVLLNIVNHTEMYVGNSQSVGAHGTYNHPEAGDQTGKEISVGAYYNYPWDCVLRYTGSDAGSGSTGGGTTDTEPTLSYGSTGSDVKFIQRRLMMLEYSCGSSGADGTFGSGTLAAVKAFQKDNGLTVDGVFGPNTRAKLDVRFKELDVFTSTCTLEGLNVRTGNGTKYPIFESYPSLKKDETVKVAKVTSNNWYFALVGKRYVAYVASKYMTKK